MKRLTALFIIMASALGLQAQPCSTTNGTNCRCADGTTNCDLLPDIMISWYGLLNDTPTEYSQTGNGAENGRLRITGSTPNVGYGAFTVLGTDYFLCGTDTIYDPSRSISSCPSGGTPTNLLKQRIYRKNGNSITYTDRWAGGQTFHPGHGHNHVDDWVSFTLRTEDPNQPDTLQWPIVGTGSKIGFCLMDLSNCNASPGDCRDSHIYGLGNVLNSSNFPNFGMGGGTYSCNPIEQGISSGYVDIYSQYLEGMWIDIPPGTCNGNYWIIAQVDPRNNFLESNENNNWTAIPFTLTKQVPVGNAAASISLSAAPYLCNNAGAITLSASAGQNYQWSTGATTPSITVTQPGDYYVQVSSACGAAISDTITISSIASSVSTTQGDTVCFGSAATLLASAPGLVSWYDSPTGGNYLHTGNTYTTNAISQNTTLYAQATVLVSNPPQQVGPPNHSGNDYSADTYNAYVSFDALDNFTLQSVKVYTDLAGPRTIQLRDMLGNILADTTINIPLGTSRIGLNFDVPIGLSYTLGTDTAQNQSTFGYISPRLRRSDSGVAYPYEIPNVVSLTGSPHGNSFYYYFFDWEVSSGSYGCPSPRIPVDVVIEDHTGIAVNGLNAAFLVSDGPVQLVATIPNGTFSGRGITTDGNGNTYFSPALAGIADSIAITYQYTTPVGCVADTVMYVSVLRETGVTELVDSRLLFYPNPSQNSITLLVPTHMENATLTVLDATGKQVMQVVITALGPRQIVDVAALATGMYILRLDGPYGSRFAKLSKL